MQYRPEIQIQHVDALSRNALPLQHITTENWITAVQNDDLELQVIINNINNYEYKKLYLLKDGILHRKVDEYKIAKMFHDNGHTNATRVIEIVQRQY